MNEVAIAAAAGGVFAIAVYRYLWFKTPWGKAWIEKAADKVREAKQRINGA